MTWSFVQHYGSATAKSSGTSLQVFSPVDPIPSGRVLICAVACDNVQTTDGNSNLVASVVGSYSGIFTKIGEYTNGEGGAGEGITVSVWARKVLTSITGGADTITVTLNNAVTARAAYVSIFHSSTQLLSVGLVQGSANDVDPAPMTMSGLSNREWLFLRVDATERESLGYVNSTNYASLGTITTSGGASDSNVSIGAEYRIATTTGDTTDPTTGSPQSASLYIALSDALIGYSMPANAGSYSLTGVSNGFLRGRNLAADTGSYSLTGNAAGLTYPRFLYAAQGSYTITGYPTNVPVDYPITVDTGSYSLTGNPATLSFGRGFSGVQGSYSLTGFDVGFSYTRSLAAEKGSYSLTGYNPNEAIQSVGKSKTQLIDAFYRQHIQTQADIRAKLGSTHHTTTPKKQAQNAADAAEQAAKKARQRRLKDLQDETADIGAEIADLDELLAYQPEFPIHKPALEQLTPVALWQQLRYTTDKMREDEKALELLLLNTI